MNDQFYISSFVRIRDGEVNVNHAISFTEKNQAAEDFFKTVYKHYQMSYPKFYKMDALCRLGFLASELLMKENDISGKYPPEDLAIILANRSSSLETDTSHQQTISDRQSYFPSPSVFVYTLPNIVIGEIAIRNKIKGENTFFIFDKFEAGFMNTYVNELLTQKRASACIAGWIEFYENNYDALLYTVETEPGILQMDHTVENLTNLFKK